MLLARALLVTLAFGILSAPLAADGQPPPKVSRVGFLSASSPSAVAPQLKAFRQALQEAGWMEGQNLAIESRWAEAKYDRLPALADELVRLKVDVIFAVTVPPALAAKKATRTIPIVFVQVADPVGLGLVASLARPGGNITGASSVQRELSGKRLELLKETIPEISRVAVLWNPENPGNLVQLRETEAAARLLKVELQPLEVRDPGGLERASAAMTREQAGGLIVLADSMLARYRTRIVELAAKSRLPAMHPYSGNVEAGGLMSYGVNASDEYRRGAILVGKILKGAKPADLPVEQPTRFELVINLKTAKALGLTIPQSVLFRADKVIE